MWGFAGKAAQQLEDVIDDVNAADSLFTEVVRYFGEDDKNMSSSEFYGIFKTFVTSYRVRGFTGPGHSEVSVVRRCRNVRRRIGQLRKRRPRWRGAGKSQKKRRRIGRKQRKKHRHKQPTRPLRSTTCSRSYGTATTSVGARVGRAPVPSARENRRCRRLQTRIRPSLRRWAVLRRTLHEACWNSSRRTVSFRNLSRHCRQRHHRHPGGVDYGRVTWLRRSQRSWRPLGALL